MHFRRFLTAQRRLAHLLR